MYILSNFDYLFYACFVAGGINAYTVCNEGVVIGDNFPLHKQPPPDTLPAVIVA